VRAGPRKCSRRFVTYYEGHGWEVKLLEGMTHIGRDQGILRS
jgi:hypothetical protein